MGGIFGVASQEDCVADVFYGTDYHSHLGTRRGGLAAKNRQGFTRFIHDITNAQFRSKFEDDLGKLHGHVGIGVISDYEDQPLIISSRLGVYAIVTVGRVYNLDALQAEVFAKQSIHFSEMAGEGINPTELVATLINSKGNFLEGIRHAQECIDGSCSILLLTDEGIYAARDRCGRTPLVIGKKNGSFAVTLETCALPNLGYQSEHVLGAGEIVLLTADGFETLSPPRDEMQICAFLWVYYGYPASSYEGINVEATRYRCGAALARADDSQVDVVAGIPDSGTGHGLGYSAEAGIPFQRPFVKYTPTWPRSFMPQDQRIRDIVAKMKLIPIADLIRGKRLLFCEDSIVRGTQLQDTIRRLYNYGAKEIHMRPACPPLVFACKFLNFSRSKSEMDLAARRAISELEGPEIQDLHAYSDPGTSQYEAMTDRIRRRLGLTSLKYQKLDDLITAIGLPRERVCSYCWNGSEGSETE